MTNIINGRVKKRGRQIRISGSHTVTRAIPMRRLNLRDLVAAPLTCSLVVSNRPGGAGGRMLHLFRMKDLRTAGILERLSCSRWDFSSQTQSMIPVPLRISLPRHCPDESLAFEREPSPDRYLRGRCSRLSSLRCVSFVLPENKRSLSAPEPESHRSCKNLISPCGEIDFL